MVLYISFVCLWVFPQGLVFPRESISNLFKALSAWWPAHRGFFPPQKVHFLNLGSQMGPGSGPNERSPPWRLDCVPSGPGAWLPGIYIEREIYIYIYRLTIRTYVRTYVHTYIHANLRIHISLSLSL